MVNSKVMSAAAGFVFEPRKLAEQQLQFGNTALALRPAAKVDIADPRWGAAQLQHLVANTVREALAAKGTSLSAWVRDHHADRSGLGYDRLIRIQRGETMMQLADLFHWATTFDTVADLLATHQFALSSAPVAPAFAGETGPRGPHTSR
ncbi:MAG: hypothetical protein H7288_06155 [Kineosporiaceae bacterium]|nr:hypothetical protein [Aeromicrobium sp.]